MRFIVMFVTAVCVLFLIKLRWQIKIIFREDWILHPGHSSFTGEDWVGSDTKVSGEAETLAYYTECVRGKLFYGKCFIFSIEYRSVTSQKIKFVKLWDLVSFSNRASLEKGPCQKLPLNCNSQPKYKG